jgi:hypothetical protein
MNKAIIRQLLSGAIAAVSAAALVGAPCPVVVYPEPDFGPGDLPFPCHCNSPFSTNVARGQATA